MNGHVGYTGRVPGSLAPALTTEAGGGTGRERAGVPGSACTRVSAWGEFIGTAPRGSDLAAVLSPCLPAAFGHSQELWAPRSGRTRQALQVSDLAPNSPRKSSRSCHSTNPLCKQPHGVRDLKAVCLRDVPAPWAGQGHCPRQEVPAQDRGERGLWGLYSSSLHRVLGVTCLTPTSPDGPD